MSSKKSNKKPAVPPPQTDWMSFKGGYSAQASKAAASKQQASSKSDKSTSKKASSSKSAGNGQKKEEKMKVDEVQGGSGAVDDQDGVEADSLAAALKAELDRESAKAQELDELASSGLQDYLDEIKRKMFKPGSGQPANSFFIKGLDLWVIFVNIIILIGAAHFCLVEGILAPTGPWVSRSHHPIFFQQVTIDNVLLHGTANAFQWSDSTELANLAHHGEAAEESLQSFDDWILALGCTPADDPYPGMTAESYDDRGKAHKSSAGSFSKKMKDAFARWGWDLWAKLVLWSVPSDDQEVASELFVYFAEFIFFMAIRSTIFGLSTNYLDTAGWSHKVTRDWIKAWLEQVRQILDKNPGLKIGHSFVVDQGLQIDAPISAVTMTNILYGEGWAVYVRSLGILQGSDYSSGELPIGLLTRKNRQKRQANKPQTKYVPSAGVKGGSD
ncbi:hypothetical protein JCM5353_006340 [Sporobolomyces roseus]